MSALNTHRRTDLVSWKTLVCGLFVYAAAAGCTEPQTAFHIVNFKGVGEREHFDQPFEECYYTASRGGRIDVVARRRDAGRDGSSPVTQIVHIRTAYRAIPGTTAAERSMINATVHLAIVDGLGGVCYEGAGFLSTKEDAERGVLIAELERAELDENRTAGTGASVFNRVLLTGTIKATRSRQRTFALLNELNRVFGPQPDYRPTPRADDPL